MSSEKKMKRLTGGSPDYGFVDFFRQGILNLPFKDDELGEQGDFRRNSSHRLSLSFNFTRHGYERRRKGLAVFRSLTPYPFSSLSLFDCG